MSVPGLVLLPLPTRLAPKSLTPDGFAPYGTTIVPPLPCNLIHGPPPLSSLSPHTPAPVLANQSSALKYSPISPLDNYYPDRSPSGEPSSPRLSLFACFPRDLRRQAVEGPESTATTALFDVRILERHPYTTQTFIPFNTTCQEQQRQAVDDGLYLVIVAPSRKGETATASVPNDATGESTTVTIIDPPDLNKAEAFVARNGQAVTYAAGTWHAPMVVMGQRRVDFMVVQFANGVGDEDCQEIAFGEGIEVEAKDGSEGAANYKER